MHGAEFGIKRKVMKTKKLFMKYFIMLFMSVALLGCGKYEEGPDFSLRSKSARLVGEWTLVTFNGNPIAGELSFELRQDNSYTLTENFVGYPKTSVSGNWNWIMNKEALTVSVDGQVDTLQILRLTKDDFWITSGPERFEFGKK